MSEKPYSSEFHRFVGACTEFPMCHVVMERGMFRPSFLIETRDDHLIYGDLEFDTTLSAVESRIAATLDLANELEGIDASAFAVIVALDAGAAILEGIDIPLASHAEAMHIQAFGCEGEQSCIVGRFDPSGSGIASWQDVSGGLGLMASMLDVLAARWRESLADPDEPRSFLLGAPRSETSNELDEILFLQYLS